MINLLKEYVRSVLLESVSTEGLAVFVGEGFFNPDSKEAVLVDLSAFKEAMKEIEEIKGKKTLITPLDVAKFAARESIVGYISVGPPTHGKAYGAWEVTRSAGPGYGKLLYAIGYALSPNGLLMPDRSSVSSSARKGWEKASKTHETLPLDPLPPENKTATKEDDSEVHDEEGYEFLDRVYKAQGWEKGTVDQLIAAGNSLEASLAKKFKGKTDSIIGRFLSAGTSLFSKHYRETI